MDQRNITNNHGHGAHQDPSSAAGLKRNSSEWDLQVFLSHDNYAPPTPLAMINSNDCNYNLKQSPPAPAMTSLEDELLFLKARGCARPNYGLLGNQPQEPIQSHLDGGMLVGGTALWPPENHNTTPKQSTISATLEYRSSMCVGTPTSSHKPLVKDGQPLGATSCSEQSDDESLEIEARQFEQSTDAVDIKRVRRMVFNRESARRSRRRRQAQLVDLESQVDQLRNENTTRYQQLTDANKQFGNAATDNRILKSDVEALRIEVKMAEDRVIRGSLCSMNYLFQGQTLSRPLLNPRSVCRATDLDILGDRGAHGTNNIPIPGLIQGNIISNIHHASSNDMATLLNHGSQPNGHRVTGLDHQQNKVSVDSTSCGPDIWAWEPHTTISK